MTMKEKTGMNILVTGGLGFIGSNFILKVLKDHEDFSIINVDAEFFGSNHKNLIELKNAPNYEYVTNGGFNFQKRCSSKFCSRVLC